MVKIVTFFLIGMVILALLGRLKFPRIGRRGDGGGTGGLPRPRLCPECGRYNLKGGPCRRCSEGQS